MTISRQAVDSEHFPTTRGRQPMISARQPTPRGRQPMPRGRQATTRRRQPMTRRRQPMTRRRQPTTRGRQPTTRGRQPMIGRRATALEMHPSRPRLCALKTKPDLVRKTYARLRGVAESRRALSRSRTARCRAGKLIARERLPPSSARRRFKALRNGKAKVGDDFALGASQFLACWRRPNPSPRRGRSRIARRFIAGNRGRASRVPEGRQKPRPSFCRPCGTCAGASPHPAMNR